jgi:hypothetical protein
MTDDANHLSMGFETACGKKIHFTTSVIPLAASLRAVTCPICRSTKKYKNALISLERELDAISKATEGGE